MNGWNDFNPLSWVNVSSANAEADTSDAFALVFPTPAKCLALIARGNNRSKSWLDIGLTRILSSLYAFQLSSSGYSSVVCSECKTNDPNAG